MRKILDRAVEKKSIFYVFFFMNLAFYEIIWRQTLVESDSTHATIKYDACA
jgi:hypothetical protein